MVSKLKKNYKQYLFLMPLILFITDYYLMINGHLQKIDHLVFVILRTLTSDIVTIFFISITQLGSLFGILIVTAGVFLFNRKLALTCLFTALFTQGLNQVLKVIIQRPRPEVMTFIHESNYSFPSGHAMAVTCLYGMLIYYFYHSNFKYRKLLIAISVVIITLVSLSRIYLGVHYFSDIIGGILLSISLILFIIHWPSLF